MNTVPLHMIRRCWYWVQPECRPADSDKPHPEHSWTGASKLAEWRCPGRPDPSGTTPDERHPK